MAGVIAVGEVFDGVLQGAGVNAELFLAAGFIGFVQGGEEIEVGHFGVDDDDAFSGQLDDHVRLAFAGLGLLGEFAMAAETGGFDDAAQGLFAPASAGLVGAEDAAELEGFAGKGLALLGEDFEVALDVADGFATVGFALLEALLVGLQLFFQRFDEALDGFLALFEIALGGFANGGEGLFEELHELRLGFLQGVRAEGLEAVAHLGEGFFKGFLLGLEALLGCLDLGLGGGESALGFLGGDLVFGVLLVELGEAFLAVRELIAEFVDQPGIAGGARLAGADEPADHAAENCAGQEIQKGFHAVELPRGRQTFAVQGASITLPGGGSQGRWTAGGETGILDSMGAEFGVFQIVVSVLILVAAGAAVIGVRRALKGLKRKVPKVDLNGLGNGARLVIFVVAFLLILSIFEFPLTAIVATIGTLCGVVAIGFVAHWSILSNFPCTFFLILFKPFSVGDELEIPADGVRGEVVDITLAYTVLRDEEGFFMNIPNAHFLQKQFRRKPGTRAISLGEQLRKSAPARELGGETARGDVKDAPGGSEKA